MEHILWISSYFWYTFSSICGLMFPKIYIWLLTRWTHIISNSPQYFQYSVIECRSRLRSYSYKEPIAMFLGNYLKKPLYQVTNSFISVGMLYFYRVWWYDNSSWSRVHYIMKRNSIITWCELVYLCFSILRKIYEMMIESSPCFAWLELDIFPILSCYTEQCWLKYIMIIGCSFDLHIYFFIDLILSDIYCFVKRISWI